MNSNELNTYFKNYVIVFAHLFGSGPKKVKLVKEFNFDKCKLSDERGFTHSYLENLGFDASFSLDIGPSELGRSITVCLKYPGGYLIKLKWLDVFIDVPNLPDVVTVSTSRDKVIKVFNRVIAGAYRLDKKLSRLVTPKTIRDDKVVYIENAAGSSKTVEYFDAYGQVQGEVNIATALHPWWAKMHAVTNLNDGEQVEQSLLQVLTQFQSEDWVYSGPGCMDVHLKAMDGKLVHWTAMCAASYEVELGEKSIGFIMNEDSQTLVIKDKDKTVLCDVSESFVAVYDKL